MSLEHWLGLRRRRGGVDVPRCAKTDASLLRTVDGPYGGCQRRGYGRPRWVAGIMLDVCLNGRIVLADRGIDVVTPADRFADAVARPETNRHSGSVSRATRV